MGQTDLSESMQALGLGSRRTPTKPIALTPQTPTYIPSSPLSPPNGSGMPRRISPRSWTSSLSSSSSSFIGSYENSLLSGHTGMPALAAIPFEAAIGVLSVDPRKETPALVCPPHIAISFGARFFSAESPYVGTLDIEGHYISAAEGYARGPRPEQNPFERSEERSEGRGSREFTHQVDIMETLNSQSNGNEHWLQTDGASASLNPASPRTLAPPRPVPPPARFPGYRVPARGQIQIILKNQNNTPIKLFLVPYDVSDLNRDGRGGRTILRHTVHVGNTLTLAADLHFTSPPTERSPRFYLYRSIRLVFRPSTTAPAVGSLRTSASMATTQTRVFSELSPFADFVDASPEWKIARKKAKERAKMDFFTIDRAQTPYALPERESLLQRTRPKSEDDAVVFASAFS